MVIESENYSKINRSITVVIPFYNSNKTLSRTLQSIHMQNYNIEVIICNDGSSENPLDITSNFEDLDIKILNEGHKGVSAARNMGWKSTTSEFIAFLDADDEWKPEFLNKINEMIEKYPGAGMYCTNREHRLSNGEDAIGRKYPIKVIGDTKDEWTGILDDYFFTAQGRPPVHSSSVVVRRSILDKTQGFCEKLNTGEDIDLWARIALDYPVAFCSKKLAVYYVPDKYYKKYKHINLNYPFLEQSSILLSNGILPKRKEISLRQYLVHFKLGIVKHLTISSQFGQALGMLKEIEWISGYRIRLAVAWIRFIILKIFRYLIWKYSKIRPANPNG